MARLERPVLLTSSVAKGFGRGATLLGCPTANMPLAELGADAVKALGTGIYACWAQVLDGDAARAGWGGAGAARSPSGTRVFKAVTSVGWNPYFDNAEKTVEPHIMHAFDGDFYGCRLKLLVCAYLRPEKNFESMQALIDAIQDDIRNTDNLLDGDEYAALRGHEFFDDEVGARDPGRRALTLGFGVAALAALLASR